MLPADQPGCADVRSVLANCAAIACPNFTVSLCQAVARLLLLQQRMFEKAVTIACVGVVGLGGLTGLGNAASESILGAASSVSPNELLGSARQSDTEGSATQQAGSLPTVGSQANAGMGQLGTISRLFSDGVREVLKVPYGRGSKVSELSVGTEAIRISAEGRQFFLPNTETVRELLDRQYTARVPRGKQLAGPTDLGLDRLRLLDDGGLELTHYTRPEEGFIPLDRVRFTPDNHSVGSYLNGTITVDEVTKDYGLRRFLDRDGNELGGRYQSQQAPFVGLMDRFDGGPFRLPGDNGTVDGQLANLLEFIVAREQGSFVTDGFEPVQTRYWTQWNNSGTVEFETTLATLGGERTFRVNLKDGKPELVFGRTGNGTEMRFAGTHPAAEDIVYPAIMRASEVSLRGEKITIEEAMPGDSFRNVVLNPRTKTVTVREGALPPAGQSADVVFVKETVFDDAGNRLIQTVVEPLFGGRVPG